MGSGRELKTGSGWREGVKVLREKRSSVSLITFMALAVALAGCASQTPSSQKPKAKRSKEYFAESKYGVKASPRVAHSTGKPLPRGGGRDQTGRPYKVKGRWYHPKEDKNYKAVGQASWYGEAFHGRLTANGEIYDMAHLTAAHPTMPLPSYARVTNTQTGSSVIVRVNDRGPYEYDRVIDLSQKAADMLGYRHHGTAKVKVEYVGRAPLDGQDDSYLMASYRPGDGDPMGQPATGVMLAMNGPTPTSSQSSAPIAASAPIPQDSPFAVNDAYGNVLSQPAVVPRPSPRPDLAMGQTSGDHIKGMAGYAPDQSTLRAYAQENTYGSILNEGAVSGAWKTQDSARSGEYVELGLFNSLEAIEKVERALAKTAQISRAQVQSDTGMVYELTAVSRKGDNDALLKAAWKAGVSDAFVVRAH
ncbi:septal ring lytic transglycosylase RlpA family protein [Brucella sp. BE17]|uniref:septal ring lytic transglycosylase RlpA family protein n=1 Tax=Brucella sp. BE17 TaxID=3142977 RepID=UPI0031BBC9B4